MCFGSVSSRPAAAVAEKPAITFRPAANETRRRFRQDGLVYLVAATGPIMYHAQGTDVSTAGESSDYGPGNEDWFQRNLDNGQLVEIAREVPTRLTAEEDTGFKLGASVQTDTGLDIDNATVIGFACGDSDGLQRVRKVVVRYTKVVEEVFNPSDLHNL